ncbi:hypothetical protein CAter282_2345 [Collimonas arenae]|uniref:Uncharacterized protein n=1 Tax=Collimonas arenae TaxID=279058 RepID=A0A127PR52_9BURK|nr:hypothetical protein CAter10_2582 [Collimonas arenae]AMP10094.1 hypothetical protein CAter282_2345 [Collimonas arenae]
MLSAIDSTVEQETVCALIRHQPKLHASLMATLLWPYVRQCGGSAGVQLQQIS